MPTRPTVFILGAGASWPYGFPTGAELRSEIIKATSNNKKRIIIADAAYTTQKNVSDFGSAFHHSNIYSIDSFLAKRHEFEKVGKSAISVVLSEKEKINQFEDIKAAEHWYQLLWNKIISNVSDVNDLTKNQIKIITFNYDRSLEHFLTTSIINSFNLSTNEAQDILQKLSILHVYGLLGNYNYEDYGNNSDSLLKVASKSIRIIPETRDDDSVFNKAQQWLFDASNIFFLGFGFDELNIKRLGLKVIIDRKRQAVLDYPLTIASTFRMTQSEVNLARDLLGIPIHNWRSEDANNLDTLRRHIYLLR